MFRRILISLFLLGCLLPVFAQEIMIEVYESGTDVWIILPYEVFRFGKDETSAEYQISTQIKNSRGNQVAVEENQITIPNRDWLRGTAIPIRKSYQLSTGSHTLNLSIRNRKLGDKQSFSRAFSVGSQATELGQVYLIAQREGFSFIPDSMELSALDSLQIKHNFAIGASQLRLDLDGETFIYENPESPFELELTEIVGSDSISSLVLSLDEMNIRYQLEPLLYKPWFSFNLRYSLQEQLEQLRYIANQNEWRVLRRVPKNKHTDAIESFWQANDPSPGTVRNENREFFYQRVLHADDQFTIHSRMKGWKSDRGRIYIKFGEPDQVVNDTFPIGRPPSITWHYFRLNRRFVFTDERGFGQYTLRNKDEEYMDY
jgi:GWxTD domain-containing protein